MKQKFFLDKDELHILNELICGVEVNSYETSVKLLTEFGDLNKIICTSKSELIHRTNINDKTAMEIKKLKSLLDMTLKTEIKKKSRICKIDKIANYYKSLFSSINIEVIHVIFLNLKNEVITERKVQSGTIDHSHCYPKEIIREALMCNASKFILIRNNPSGRKMPNIADYGIFCDLKKMAKALNLVCSDYLVIENDNEIHSLNKKRI